MLIDVRSWDDRSEFARAQPLLREIDLTDGSLLAQVLAVIRGEETVRVSLSVCGVLIVAVVDHDQLHRGEIVVGTKIRVRLRSGLIDLLLPPYGGGDFAASTVLLAGGMAMVG